MKVIASDVFHQIFITRPEASICVADNHNNNDIINWINL